MLNRTQISIPNLVRVKPGAVGRVGLYARRADFTDVVVLHSEDLNADILEGHLSSGLCHTGNISYRLGKKSKPEEILEQVKGDRGAEESFGRMKEHLAKNEVDVTKDLLTIGPALKFDADKEQFIDN